jgi:hypothetical protein
VPALHLAALTAAGAGYMSYRTVPEFPAVTERVVIALSATASGQKSAAHAMTAANGEILRLLERAGHKVR